MTKIYTVGEIFSELEDCITQKKPFSLIRYGDGGIKLLHSYFYKDKQELDKTCKKEGLLHHIIPEVIKLWGIYGSKANFIDHPEVFLLDNFWGQCKKGPAKISEKTLLRIKMWKELYQLAGFDIENSRYCNPEVNYLMCLNRSTQKSILDIMRGHTICIITAQPRIKQKLAISGFKTDIITIVPQYQNHFIKNFHLVIKEINKRARDYDLWLIGAGELGRVYSGRIKDMGGRTVDMGFALDYWVSGKIPVRLRDFVKRDRKNSLLLTLTNEGKPFEKSI